MSERNTVHPLTRWRFNHGLSLAALGKKVRASAPHLSDIENGEKNPSVALLSRLAKVTGLSANAISPTVRARLTREARAMQKLETLANV